MRFLINCWVKTSDYFEKWSKTLSFGQIHNLFFPYFFKTQICLENCDRLLWYSFEGKQKTEIRFWFVSNHYLIIPIQSIMISFKF